MWRQKMWSTQAEGMSIKQNSAFIYEVNNSLSLLTFYQILAIFVSFTIIMLLYSFMLRNLTFSPTAPYLFAPNTVGP